MSKIDSKTIPLGNRAEDSLTEFAGIVIGRAVYSYGASELLIQQTSCNDDGKPCSGHWMKECRMIDLGTPGESNGTVGFAGDRPSS